jgi:hypothetical protein
MFSSVNISSAAVSFSRSVLRSRCSRSGYRCQELERPDKVGLKGGKGLKNSTYFDFVRLVNTEEEGRSLLTRGEVQFVINIPQNFSHDLLRGDKPAILVEADATDPMATSAGVGLLEASSTIRTGPC